MIAQIVSSIEIKIKTGAFPDTLSFPFYSYITDYIKTETRAGEIIQQVLTPLAFILHRDITMSPEHHLRVIPEHRVKREPLVQIWVAQSPT